MARKQFILYSNAELGENHSKLWNDQELKAIDLTRRGKLELKPKNIKAQVFLNRTGTIEVFCRREDFRPVFTLLKRKLVPVDGELRINLGKVPTTYSISFDYIDIVLYATIISTIIGVLLYAFQTHFHIPEVILFSLVISILAVLLVIYYRWNTVFPS